MPREWMDVSHLSFNTLLLLEEGQLSWLITDIPFPPEFADITLAGHVFGESLEEEYRELRRVSKSGGMIILCPGNNDLDNETHAFLLSHGFESSRFEEPREGMKRKY